MHVNSGYDKCCRGYGDCYVAAGAGGAEDDGGFFADGEFVGAEGVGAVFVFGGLGLIDGDGFFAVGGEEGDGGGFGAVFVGLEVDADFVAAGLLDAEGEAGAGVFFVAVAVVFADEGLEAFAVGPFAGELGFGVVDDEAFEFLVELARIWL